MAIEVKFRASDNCITEAELIEAARASWAETVAEAMPTADYFRDACEDLRKTGQCLAWMSAGSFADAVSQGIERRLFELVRHRRGESGFDLYITGEVKEIEGD